MSSNLDHAETALWPPPQPLRNGPPGGCPTHTFPTELIDAATTVAHHVQVPIELPLQVGLGVLSTALTFGRAHINIRHGWTEGANLYLLTPMDPGSGKSPAQDHMTRPLWPHVDTWHRGQLTQRARAQAAAKIAGKDAGRADNIDELTAAIEAEHTNRLSDIEPIAIIDDATPEALELALDANGGIAAAISDEGGPIDTVVRYIDQRSEPNVKSLTQAWSGGQVIVLRTNRRLVIPNARLVMSVLVQPHKWRRIAGNDDFAGRGLLDRFMVAWPEGLVGQRDFTGSDPLDPDALHRWASCIDRLAEDHPWTDSTRTLILDTDGRDLFDKWRTDIEQRPDRTALAGIPEKISSSVARVALIFACVDGAGSVTCDHMARACEVGDWWLANAMYARGIEEHAVDVVDLQAAERILEWCERRSLPVFGMRDLSRSGPIRRTHPRHDDRLGPLGVLIDHGWIRPNESSWDEPGNRGVSTATFTVHPSARHKRDASTPKRPDSGRRPLSVGDEENSRAGVRKPPLGLTDLHLSSGSSEHPSSHPPRDNATQPTTPLPDLYENGF